MTGFADKLCGVERDRVTAAEICIDECLTILDRHGVGGALYTNLRNLSGNLNQALLAADGMNARYDRLIRVRQALTTAFPMTDEDLEAHGTYVCPDARLEIIDAEREAIEKRQAELDELEREVLGLKPLSPQDPSHD